MTACPPASQHAGRPRRARRPGAAVGLAVLLLATPDVGAAADATARSALQACRAVPTGGRVRISVADEDLAALARLIGCMTGKTIVLGDDVRGWAGTFVTPSPVTAAEVFTAFAQALAAHGLRIVETGDVRTVQASGQIAQVPGVGDEDAPPPTVSTERNAPRPAVDGLGGPVPGTGAPQGAPAEWCRPPPKGARVHLNVVQEDLATVVELFACVTRKTIVLVRADRRHRTITIDAPSPLTIESAGRPPEGMSVAEAYAAFLRALAAQGLKAVAVDAVAEPSP